MKIFHTQGMYHSTDAERSRWLSKLRLAIKLDKRDSGLFLQLGSILFLCDDIKGAVKAIKKAQDCAPRDDPSSDFSMAFLHLWNNEFRQARNCYRVGMLRKDSYNTQGIMHIVEFIQQVLIRYPKKIQFHFALGYINENRLDQSRAADEYRLFLKGAKEHPFYSRFMAEAEAGIARMSK